MRYPVRQLAEAFRGALLFEHTSSPGRDRKASKEEQRQSIITTSYE